MSAREGLRQLAQVTGGRRTVESDPARAERFLNYILDCRRQQAATWNGTRLNAEHPDGDLLAGALIERCLAGDEPSATEARSQALWKTFHRTVAIETRTSPALQRQFMPARYWKHLTEMQE